MIIKLLAIIGFWLSFYAYYVEKKAGKKSAKENYRPVCDISPKISCTKAFSSKYGRLLGMSNSLFGMFFYLVIYILFSLNLFNYVFFLSVLSVPGSIYLAYISYIKLKTFCLVCTSIYLINFLLLFLSYKSL